MDAFKAEADELYAKLRTTLTGVQHLISAKYALSWDQETGMPKAAADERAATVGHLDSLIHDAQVTPEYARLIQRLNQLSRINGPSAEFGRDAVVRLATRQHERELKLPTSFVRELSALCSSSQVVWTSAREANDWNLFRPCLERIVEMKRQEARLIGYLDSPYDPLIDYYEPGMTTRDADALLSALRKPLTDTVRRVGTSTRRVTQRQGFIPAPLAKQRKLNKLVAKRLGFDFGRGRLSTTTHPFMIRLHPSDVRILTRYMPHDTLYGLGSTIHEAGHGMYEQGLPSELYGTPAGEVLSMGLHESQSRLWERFIGGSRPFCEWLHGVMSDSYIVPVSVNDIYGYLNAVAPSFIRTEADEVTYNLHICIRFDLDRALIEGSLDVADVPEAFNGMMQSYLGITPPTLAEGVLQDVHWSCGWFGYFPTYALGNVYAAQLFSAMNWDIGPNDVCQQIRAGQFAELLEWQRTNVHRFGSTLPSADIIRNATGEAPSSRHFLAYVDRKVRQTYGV